MTLNDVRFIEEEMAATSLAPVANAVMTLPAQTIVMAAGVEVTEALAGASARIFDLGTGDDEDEFIAAYAMAGKSFGATAPSLPGAAYKGEEDTLDIIVATLSGTATGGKLRVWEVICDVDGYDADAVDCKYLA